MEVQTETEVTLNDLNEEGVRSASRQSSTTSNQWFMWGRAFPRAEVKFFTQVIILYVVILTCLANLTVGKGELKSVWISLLGSCLGCLLPSPSIKSKESR